MNVLFLLYHDFTANSSYHVHSLACQLVQRGHSCAVAAPFRKETIDTLSANPPYAVRDFLDLRDQWIQFPDGHGPDIVHAWTPREVVRQLVDDVRARHSFRLVVHLEDNERHLTERSLGRGKWADLARLPRLELDGLIPGHLSHPQRSEELLASADGVTVILDRLRELVPAGVPVAEFWASADEDLFYPRRRDEAKRLEWKIAENEIALAYTGNVHASNAAEVRSVYLAVAMLNREGQPARLIRTGRDFVPFLGEKDDWARQHSIELGFVDRAEMPRVLAASDYLVQPGAPGPFNDYRFPSKVPEFFAIGRPVILPRTNIGLVTRHLEDAYVVDKADACTIFDAVMALQADPQLAARLSAAGTRFFHEHLRWHVGAERLMELYRSLT